MGVFNPADGSIHLKVVYYGPARGGKTTNLEQVRRILDPEGESAILSVSTGDDTTLFFDHLPLDLQLLGRHRVRVQGFTVPGQVRFDRTRRLVLQGCDGVVFVADSAPDRIDENVEAMKNLHENLRRNGLDPDVVPIVIQYNKRDLEDGLAIDALDRALGMTGKPCHLATALNGDGVFETFRDVLLAAMSRVHEEFGLARYGLRCSDTQEALEGVLGQRRRTRPVDGEPAGAGRRTLQPTSSEPAEGALLEAAVATSIDLAELVGVVTSERTAATRRLTDVLETTQGVVHDLRKPVSALTSAMWLLRRHASEVDDESVREELAIAEGAIAEMTGLLDDCATRLCQSEAPREEVVDLSSLVGDVLRSRVLVARAAQVDLRVSGSFPSVEGHKATLTSLVTNLVDNGIKYRSRREELGHVEVVGHPQRDGGFALVVRDNGIGLPPGEREAVFQKHQRGSNSAGIEGSGLGLHLARRIAHAHDARIGLRSTSGVGTLVRVRFPACRVAAPARVGPAIAATAAAGDSAEPECSLPHAPGPSARSSVRTGSS